MTKNTNQYFVIYFIILADKVPGTQSIYVKTFGCSHNISDS